MGGRIDEGMPRMANERLPERSVFIAIAHAGWRGHTKVWKAGVVAWYGELAPRIPPRPSSAPAGDKPPHYIPPSPLLDSGLRRMTKSVAVVCFHSNRSCRLAPAHQGMESRSCGLVRRIGTADSATPLLRPSGGQAPALHSPLPTPGFRPSPDDEISRGSLFS